MFKQFKFFKEIKLKNATEQVVWAVIFSRSAFGVKKVAISHKYFLNYIDMSYSGIRQAVKRLENKGFIKKFEKVGVENSYRIILTEDVRVALESYKGKIDLFCVARQESYNVNSEEVKQVWNNSVIFSKRINYLSDAWKSLLEVRLKEANISVGEFCEKIEKSKKIKDASWFNFYWSIKNSENFFKIINLFYSDVPNGVFNLSGNLPVPEFAKVVKVADADLSQFSKRRSF